MAVDERHAIEVKERHSAALRALPFVVGVGVGEADGEAVIRLYVTPLDGVRVVLIPVGTIATQEGA